MKTITFRFLFIAMMSVLLGSCTGTSTSKFISIDDYSFARAGIDGQLVTVDDPAVFKRGEDVHLILLDVGPFRKDDEGLNWFDIDMEVTDSDGKVIISETGMLGDAGHVALENNHAGSPYGSCTNTAELAPGKYKFKLTIYDKIGNGKAAQNAFFTLE